MPGRRFAVPTAAVLAPAAASVLLAACSGTAPRRDAPAPTSSPASLSTVVSGVVEAQTLRCGAAIDGAAPPDDDEVVLGVVALPTSPRSRALQAFDSGDPGVPALFAKTGLVIRAGAPLELEVDRPAADPVGIGWGGGPSRPSRRFEVPPCPDSRGTGWLAFPGGYWADRPSCLALVVRSAGREQRVQIGVGRACPGQQAPATP